MSNQNIQLMQKMLADQKETDTKLGSGEYWLPHTEEMVSIIEKQGIENFRGIPEKPLMAFATGTPYKPDRNSNKKFWILHDVLKKIPCVNTVPKKYEEIIQKGFNSAKSQAHTKLTLIYVYLKEKAPQFLEVPEKIIGNPATFEIEGKTYSEIYMHKLFELYLLSQRLDLTKISSLFEIGGSFGLLSSAILNNFPNIKRYVILDVAPVPAFAEYYLGHAFPGEVQGYAETRQAEKINLENSDKRITILCSHQLSQLGGRVDLSINTASFQEMEADQVAEYCDFIAQCSSYSYINNIEYSEFNELTTKDYKKMMQPMQAQEHWKNILSPQYVPTLFKA